MLRKKGINFFLIIFLLFVYIINGLVAIHKNSVTYDEMDHWSYGKRILKLQPQKVYPFDDASAMPVTGLNAMPRAVEQLLNPKLMKTDGGFSDIMHGRYITLFICLLTGYFIYRWSKELFGEKGGLLSLFLFVFCPNLNAHGTLLTTDAYTALFTLTTAYYYWKFVKQSGWKNFMAFSLSLGLAQLAKYSSIHMFFIFALVSVLLLIKRKSLFTRWKPNLLRLSVLLIVVLTVINIGYFFNNTGKSLSSYETRSHTFTKLKNTLLGSIPLPFPTPYIEGMDLTTYMNELGAGDPNVSGANYLLGEKRTGTGFWYYYFVVVFYKTPLTVLLMIISAIVFLCIRKKKEGHPSSMLFLLGISFYFLLMLGLTNNVQIGIRHAIMIYPLLYVLAGFLFTWPVFLNRANFIIPVLILYSAISYYFFFPNLISYTNELITDKKKACTIMADSNIDYGQGGFVLEKYLKSHPNTRLAGKEQKAGTCVISVNDYLDLKNTGEYNWLKQYSPTGHVNFCFLLFDIPSTRMNK